MKIITRAHVFNFDTREPADKAAYEALRKQLKAHGVRKMRSLTTSGDSYHATGRKIEGDNIELETDHIFDNQWNTKPIAGVSDLGLRVFDWCEDAIFVNGHELKHRRCGYWLDQTPEMAEVRRNTYKCGYCGKQEPAAKGYVFCPHCIDSEYLTEGDLHLTRMKPAGGSFMADREPLTAAEHTHLLPLYKEAQLHGTTARGKARIAKRRADIDAKYKKETRAAKAERDGLIWLIDHGIHTDNVIYYSHTERFCFGWRGRLGETVKSALLDVLSEFPFDYDIEEKTR